VCNVKKTKYNQNKKMINIYLLFGIGIIGFIILFFSVFKLVNSGNKEAVPDYEAPIKFNKEGEEIIEEETTQDFSPRYHNISKTIGQVMGAVVGGIVLVSIYNKVQSLTSNSEFNATMTGSQATMFNSVFSFFPIIIIVGIFITVFNLAKAFW
jgi:hypothetical protein